MWNSPDTGECGAVIVMVQSLAEAMDANAPKQTASESLKHVLLTI
jgi:hypothetical protein